MAPTFVYRAFHNIHSAGVNSRDGFKSGLAKSEDVRADEITLKEHSDALNRNPTPWISTTDQLLRAILRAVNLADTHGIVGVHIAVISVEKCQPCPPVQASKMRFQLQLGYEPWHNHEFLTRWEIPGNAIVSSLPLQILKNRGMFTMVPQALRFAGVDECLGVIMEEWQRVRDKNEYLQDVGVKAARFSHLFGAGEHTEYIGLETARWWEHRVGTESWSYGFGRYFFLTFDEMIRRGTNHRCFDW